MHFGSSTSTVTMIPNLHKAMLDHILHKIDSVQSKIFLLQPKISYGKVKTLDKVKAIELKEPTECLLIAKWASSKNGTRNNTKAKK